MPQVAPVVFGTFGLGGYAGSICSAIERCGVGADGQPPAVRLAAVCEPDHVTHAAKIAELRGKGVQVFERYDEMLALHEVEAVWVPLPIDLHRSYTERALAAGKAVMCEKPAAGCVDDLDAMIVARDRAKLPVAIGFQDVYDPTTLPLKRRLLAGELGKVMRTTVHACWPRNANYFGRSNWAGAFKRNGVWVMDSPANNALAHYINIPMFLMGASQTTSAQPIAVEAELYRVNPIENFDTISMRVQLDTGASLLVLFTHACTQQHNPTIVIEGERGKVTRTNERIEIVIGDRNETIARGSDPQGATVRRFAKLVRAVPDDTTALATLEVARAQLAAVNGASEASVIHALPEVEVETSDFHGAPLRSVRGIESAIIACAASGRMLHESGLLSWTRPAGHKDLRGYTRFAGPKLA